MSGPFVLGSMKAGGIRCSGWTQCELKPGVMKPRTWGQEQEVHFGWGLGFSRR